MLLWLKSKPLRCVIGSKMRPGKPVSVNRLLFNSNELPATSLIDGTPAKRSAGKEVMLLCDRSR